MNLLLSGGYRIRLCCLLLVVAVFRRDCPFCLEDGFSYWFFDGSFYVMELHYGAKHITNVRIKEHF